MDSRIFFNDNTQTLDIDELNSLRSWIIFAAKTEGYFVGELGFIFCDDKCLHNINVNFLNHDTYTDVITFDYGNNTTIEGEIYISLDRVRENATKFNVKVSREIRRIIIHGVLHLLGYEDKNPKDKNLMTSKEDYYLSLQPDSE